MSKTIVPTSLQGLLGSIKKSKRPLAPIYEAITNSLEAIAQKDFSTNELPEIEISFHFKGLLDELKNLDYLTISDNGIGFTEENYKRFETLLDNSKGFNNRGSGRLQLVQRFEKVKVVSFYNENGKYFKRTFLCDLNNFTHNHENILDKDKHPSGSSITLFAGKSLNKEKKFYDDLEISQIVQDLKRQFLLWFYLNSQISKAKSPTIKISFIKNGIQISQVTIQPSEMPKPSQTGELSVSYLKPNSIDKDAVEWVTVPNKKEKLKWVHFELPANELEHNSVCLCSKGVVVEPLSFEIIKKADEIRGRHYLTAFYGDVLDKNENVSHSVDSFCFPEQKLIEEQIKEGDFYLPEQEFLFIDTIKKEINKALPNIYKNIIDLKENHLILIEKIAAQHGISLEIARKIKICLSDNKEKIIEKLYRMQADVFSTRNQKIQKTFKDLNKLNPTSKNYQSELEKKSRELLELIPQQNKEELGRYVIRREMVADILGKILAQELNCQNDVSNKRKDREGLIHDLIFKRKNHTSELNDLWILNEEFIHFEGYSDLPINKLTDSNGKKLLREISDEELKFFGLKIERRPDIFLYPEEGKCILIELKAPEEDLTNHLNQMNRYCNLIANFSTTKIDKFYCYLIGENINRIDLPGDYTKTITGDLIKTDLPVLSVQAGKEDDKIASIQIEIIKLSSIYTRAHRRNKSFADKLGLRSELDQILNNENIINDVNSYNEA